MTMLHIVIPGVVFSAVQAGEHTVHVTRDGNDIARSPFTVMVSDSEIGRAEGVKVYGRGLSEGETGQPCQFFIDTSDAGQSCSLHHLYHRSLFIVFFFSFLLHFIFFLSFFVLQESHMS